MAQNICVAAVGTTFEPAADGLEEAYTSVTLYVTPEDAMRINQCGKSGPLTLVLRASGDHEKNTENAILSNQLLEKASNGKQSEQHSNQAAAFSADDRKASAGLLQDEALRIVCSLRPDKDGLKKAGTQPADVLLLFYARVIRKRSLILPKRCIQTAATLPCCC